MTPATHCSRLSRLFLVLPFVLASASTTIAGDGLADKHAQPLEARRPGGAIGDDSAGPLSGLILETEFIDDAKDTLTEADAASRKAAMKKRLDAAKKKAMALLSFQQGRAEKHAGSDKAHEHAHHEHAHHDSDHKGLLTVNVIVTVNVNSGNVIGPAGPPRPGDEARQSARRQDFERVVREQEATIDRLRRELDSVRDRTSPEARAQAEQRSREFRDRFEQMQLETRRRFEEMRRERDERAKRRDADAVQEANKDAATDEESAEDEAAETPDATEPTDELGAPQASAPRGDLVEGDLVEFVTSLFQ